MLPGQPLAEPRSRVSRIHPQGTMASLGSLLQANKAREREVLYLFNRQVGYPKCQIPVQKAVVKTTAPGRDISPTAWPCHLDPRSSFPGPPLGPHWLAGLMPGMC